MSFYGSAFLMVAAISAYMLMSFSSQASAISGAAIIPYKIYSSLMLQTSAIAQVSGNSNLLSLSIDGVNVSESAGIRIYRSSAGLYCVYRTV